MEFVVVHFFLENSLVYKSKYLIKNIPFHVLAMFQENSIETSILSRVKQITSPGWMHETSTWTWCTGPREGAGGEGGGRGDRDGEHM